MRIFEKLLGKAKLKRMLALMTELVEILDSPESEPLLKEQS